VLTVAADGGGEFATIRDALRRAPSGARILVKPGLYRERLRFDPTSRPVEIVGDGPAGAVRVEAPNGPALEVAGGAVEVRRLTLAARRQAPRPVVRVTAGRPLLDDCLIVGGGTAAVVACGPAAQPVLRGCRLHDARKVGLLVDDRARALMEGGRLADHGRAGAEVVFGGRLELRGVTVRDNGGPGVLARPFTEVRLTDGVIAANAGAGLSGRQAVVRASGVQFEDGRSVGVRVVGGLVLLERCTVRGHARANVAVRRFSKAWLRGCRLEEGRSHGLRIVGPSQTLLDDCTVTANAGKGVVVRRQGCPHLRRCRIHDNGGVALDLPARAVVDLNACRLGERWKVADGATVRLYRPAGV
jgi:hypothetical protein